MPYSEKMHSPELKKCGKFAMGIKWSPMLPLIATVLAAIWLLGLYAPDAVDPITLWGVGGIVLALILFFTLILPLIDQAGYEGDIYNKKIVKARVKEGQDSETYTQYHFAPILFIRTVKGRKHQLEVSKEAYAYFSIGDTIKTHRGFPYPEKRDKDGDELILCPRCGHTYDRDREQCPSCRMPNIL